MLRIIIYIEWLTTRGRNSWAGNENEMQWKYELEQDPYWSSWNSFFGRHFADEYYKKYRCIAGPKDPNVIISCNDGTAFRWRDNIKLTDTFWLKDMPYSIQNIFGGEKDEKGYAKRFADKFVGGKIFQTFLNPYNYHRWNSPVKGKIIIADVLKRYYYSKLINPDFDGVSTASCPYLLEVNCRGIVIIDTTGPKEKGYANIGLVCCIPIGMCEVSSIKYDSKIRPSADIEKGQELGYFKFGGSSFAIMFQDTTKYGKELVFLSDHKLGFKGNWGSNIFPRDAPTPQVSGGIGIPVNVNMQIGYLIPSKITTK